MTRPAFAPEHDGNEGTTVDDTTVPAATGKAKTAVEALRRLIAERAGGEARPQQEEMAAAIEAAIATKAHLLVQAGTGTGKSLGYLVPAIMSGKKVVVSTGTKALGEQIAAVDLPALHECLPRITGRQFRSALLKGRPNYICLREVAEIQQLELQDPDGGTVRAEPRDDPEQDLLFGEPTPVAAPRAPVTLPTPAVLGGGTNVERLIKWSEKTETGDRSDVPFPISDADWMQVSTTSDGCPGRSACPFGEDCFTELAREKAKSADLVVTNHALVANDLKAPTSVLGPWQIWVADEGHEVQDYLSSSLGTSLTPTGLRDTAARAAKQLPPDHHGIEIAVSLIADATAVSDLLMGVKPGLLTGLPDDLAGLLDEVYDRLTRLESALLSAARTSTDEETEAGRKAAAGRVAGAAETVDRLRTDDPDYVRWYDKGKDESRAGTLHLAPLKVGPAIIKGLGKDRTMIVTSATLTVGGAFDSAVRTFGLDLPAADDEGDSDGAEPREHHSLDVGSPFDYPRQVLIYIPDAPFPTYDYSNQDVHAAAVHDGITTLVRAAGGRTLALFTTTYAAAQAAKHLRRQFPGLTVLAQGDMPSGQLTREFADDEHSVLCGTATFWTGIDVPGKSLSLVTIDRLPFAPQSDPLMSARRTAVDKERRDGFGEVYVASAAVKLAQGAGRLVRSMTDRGVIAVFDTRVMTKGYSRTMLANLPNGWRTRDETVVIAALERLTGGMPDTPARRIGKPKTGTPGTPRRATRRR